MGPNADWCQHLAIDPERLLGDLAGGELTEHQFAAAQPHLATTIPSAPGYIGTFDAPGIAVLEAYGVPGALAAGYTLVLHAALWLPITLLGAYYMARESLSWSQVQAEVAEEPS